MSRVLLLLEETERTPPGLSDLLGDAAEVEVYALTDASDAAIAGMLGERRCRIVRAAADLDHLHDAYVAAVRGWLAAGLDGFAGQPGWDATYLFEWNYAHREWLVLLRAMAALDHARRSPCQGVAVAGGADFCRLVAGALPGTRAAAVPGSTRGVWRMLAGRLRDMLREAGLLWAARGLPREAKGRLLAYCSWPWQWSGGNFRIFGRHLPTRLPGMVILASLSRTNARALRPSARQDAAAFPPAGFAGRMIAVESFGRWRDLLACYLSPRPALRWLRAWRRMPERLAGMPVKAVLGDAALASAIGDLPRNTYLTRCVTRAVAAAGAKAMVLPIYELAEGRAVCRGARMAGAQVFGLQHGSHAPSHSWRAVQALGVVAEAPGGNGVPDALLLESGLEAARARSDGPRRPVHVVGAARMADDPAPNGKVEPDPARVMVLGSLFQGARLFEQCIEALTPAGFEVVLRPHPGSSVDVRRFGGQVRWSDPSLPLAEEVARWRPLATVSRATSTAAEAAFLGVPAAILLSNVLPNLSPLPSDGDTGGFVAADAGTLADWLCSLRHDPTRARWSARCLDAAKCCYAATGAEAAERIATVLEQAVSTE